MIATGVLWAAHFADGVAIVVMVIGFVMALVGFVPTLWHTGRVDAISKLQMIRCNFGVYLVFALELMIVSDLLHSVLSRRLEDLYLLGGLVVIRTLIAYFLNQEIKELSEA